LPDEVRAKAKLCLLDPLGCGLGACQHDDILQLRQALSVFDSGGGALHFEALTEGLG
jgi:2-methylcitrate dehydratase PrpD